MIDNRWMERELGGQSGLLARREMETVQQLYDWYEGRRGGEEEAPLSVNLIKKLIKDEARFMAGRPPEIRLQSEDGAAAAALEDWLRATLEDNRWQRRLMQGVRDCLIGRRVALKLGGAPGARPSLRFVPSTGFLYETEPDNCERLSWILFFCWLEADAGGRAAQRLWRQKYWMENGRCLVDESVCDAAGRPLEVRSERRDTGLDFIPAYVIVNDGLSGDVTGESDVSALIESQRAYDRLKSDDLDALRYNMFPQKVFVDASQQSIDKVVIAPNAMIDLVTDPAAASGRQASASVLEGGFPYDARLENALSRIKSDMYELVSVPEMTPERLQGFSASGQSMKALYWSMICRCEEKWACWDDALRWMVRGLAAIARAYRVPDAPEGDFAYTVKIEHLYPITGDEEDERRRDMEEVRAGVRSRLSYIRKWQVGEDARAELERLSRDAAAQKVLAE